MTTPVTTERGCCVTLAVIATLTVLAAIAAIAAGCAAAGYVVPADRELVPLRRDANDPTLYCVEESADCTGWFVPNAALAELLEAAEE